MTIQSIIIFLSILLFLVVVHELGHFLLAKFFKMRVDEFAFGFPPRLLQKKIGETLYSFNLIPLGGYVKIFGENGLEEEQIKNLNEIEKKKLFGSKSAWSRILVLCGGVVFNILAAFVLFTFAFLVGSNVSLEKSELNNSNLQNQSLVVVYIDEKSSLQDSTISLGDIILSLKSENQVLENPDLNSYTASAFIQEHINSSILITYKTEKGKIDQFAAIAKPGILEGKKILGAKFADVAFKKYSFGEAIAESFKTTYEQLFYIFSSLGELISNLLFTNTKVEDNLSGPIGLAFMTSKVSEKGLGQVLTFAGLLSLSLAVFNILPIPALDGGRVFFVFLEVVRRKKIKASTEQLFHGLGFLILLCLMVFVSYFDIVKAFGGP